MLLHRQVKPRSLLSVYAQSSWWWQLPSCRFRQEQQEDSAVGADEWQEPTPVQQLKNRFRRERGRKKAQARAPLEELYSAGASWQPAKTVPKQTEVVDLSRPWFFHCKRAWTMTKIERMELLCFTKGLRKSGRVEANRGKGSLSLGQSKGGRNSRAACTARQIVALMNEEMGAKFENVTPWSFAQLTHVPEVHVEIAPSNLLEEVQNVLIEHQAMDAHVDLAATLVPSRSPSSKERDEGLGALIQQIQAVCDRDRDIGFGNAGLLRGSLQWK